MTRVGFIFNLTAATLSPLERPSATGNAARDIMSDFLKTGSLPPEQELIRAKCFHPSGTFVAFAMEETEQSIPSRFEKMARLYPGQIAVKSQTGILTYEALNATANRIAHRILRQYGDNSEPVALLADHDELTVAAMMGILKAGKICMPLDPSHSRERLVLTLKDAQTATVVASAKNRDRLTGLAAGSSSIVSDDEINAALPAENPCVPVSPDALAYIEYTSGSTGEPKGIMQSHRVKLHRVLRNTNSLHICALDRIALFSYLVTAWGTQASLNALLNGSTLALFDIREAGVLPLAHWLRCEGITIYASAPTLFRNLANTLSDTDPFPAIRSVRLNGERILRDDVEIFKQYFSPDCILEVSFAASETGTFCQYFIDKQSMIAGDTVPVGYPEDRMELLILNDARETVGAGVSGEIAIKSPCCSIGYWRRPEETAAKFLVDPSGSDPRVFMTGDLGRLRPDGCLEYLGRKDFLVKIRGHRVELGEVEETLRACDGVQAAAVVLSRAEGKEERLIGYVVGNGKTPISETALRRDLERKLPEYMVPSRLIVLDAIPTTATGKIDRHVLPDPDQFTLPLAAFYVAPTSYVEQRLAEIWADVLSVNRVGIHDDFFDLGGHSLLAMRIISKVNDILGVELSMRSLLGAPTVAGLAGLVESLLESRKGTVPNRSAPGPGEETGEL
jgi:amino acid adenylation domain-containing protein